MTVRAATDPYRAGQWWVSARSKGVNVEEHRNRLDAPYAPL